MLASAFYARRQWASTSQESRALGVAKLRLVELLLGSTIANSPYHSATPFAIALRMDLYAIGNANVVCLSLDIPARLNQMIKRFGIFHQKSVLDHSLIIGM